MSAISNDTALSKVGTGMLERLQNSLSSVANLTDSICTPESAECQLSGNVMVLESGVSIEWSRNRLSEMSLGSEVVRVSAPSSSSSAHLAGLVHDDASAVDGGDVGYSERSAVFPSVVETPCDTEVRKTPSLKTKDISSSEVETADLHSEHFYLRSGDDRKEHRDNSVEEGLAGSGCAVHDETGIEASNDNEMVTTQKVHLTDDLGKEATDTSTKLSSEALATDFKIAEDTLVDSGKELMPGANASEETWPAMKSNDSAQHTEETFCDDLPACQAPIDMIDVLPLDDLPPAVSDLQTQTKIDVGWKDGSLVSAHDDDNEVYSDWPPLPSDDDLKIFDVELKLSAGDDLQYKDIVVDTDQHDASVDGTLTKVGASEKVLTHATHLRDADSMQRFK